MPTGACGINCDVCQLNLLGLCTTCGSGKSPEAHAKKAVMESMFGKACPVLDCVILNNKEYCIRDCGQFPCENYHLDPYPFSEAYIQMQQRRRESPVLQLDTMGKPIEISEDLWDLVLKKDLNLVAANSLAREEDGSKLVFDFLDQHIVLDLQNRVLYQRFPENDLTIDNNLLGLTALSYFAAVDRLYPMGKDLITTDDMQQAVYFSGHNRLKKEPVIRRFINDIEAFKQAGLALGGQVMNMADAAIVLYPFPRVPVYYLFWQEQKEDFRLSILFDRSIESVMEPPMIWGLVQLVNAYLLTS